MGHWGPRPCTPQRPCMKEHAVSPHWVREQLSSLFLITLLLCREDFRKMPQSPQHIPSRNFTTSKQPFPTTLSHGSCYKSNNSNPERFHRLRCAPAGGRKCRVRRLASVHPPYLRQRAEPPAWMESCWGQPAHPWKHLGFPLWCILCHADTRQSSPAWLDCISLLHLKKENVSCIAKRWTWLNSTIWLTHTLICMECLRISPRLRLWLLKLWWVLCTLPGTLHLAICCCCCC